MAHAGQRPASHARHPHGARRPVSARDHKVEEMRGYQVLSRRQVAELLDISLPTLWRMRMRGGFPQPFRVSPGRVGWCAHTVWQWLADRNGEV